MPDTANPGLSHFWGPHSTSYWVMSFSSRFFKNYTPCIMNFTVYAALGLFPPSLHTQAKKKKCVLCNVLELANLMIS